MSNDYWSSLINNLFPAATPASLVDMLKPKGEGAEAADLLDVIMQSKKSNFLSPETYGPKGEVKSQKDMKYLGLADKKIKMLAAKIVKPGDSNDTKMQKILDYIKKNFTYVSDDVQYHTGEYWATPGESIKSMKGDCEDGAFLIQALGLAAGVPGDRLRTYAGLVKAGKNAPLGGHAWTVYKLEKSNKPITLDWCYYPTPVDTSIKEQKEYYKDKNYQEVWWYLDYKGTTQQPGWGINKWV